MCDVVLAVEVTLVAARLCGSMSSTFCFFTFADVRHMRLLTVGDRAFLVATARV